MPFCMYCNFLLTFRSKFSRFPKCVAVQKVTNIRSNVERFLQCPTLWRTMPGARSWNFHTQVWQFLLAPWLLKTLKLLVFELGLVSLRMVSNRIWNESVQERKYISVLIFSLSCFVPQTLGDILNSRTLKTHTNSKMPGLKEKTEPDTLLGAETPARAIESQWPGFFFLPPPPWQNQVWDMISEI